MKRILLVTFFAGVLFPAFAQEIRQVSIGTIDTIHSQVLGETRRIWVYVPNGSPGKK